MADAEERARAEKVAAARKRFQKAKKAAKKTVEETNKETVTAEPTQITEKQDDNSLLEQGKKNDAGCDPGNHKEASPEQIPEALGSEVETGVREANEETLSRGTHRRQPSLSLQSKIRSSSFRQTSAPQALPLSHSLTAAKSPTLHPLSPDGDTIPEVFRKQARRLEEVERENKRLEKELEDAHTRWKRSDEQLEELREASGDVVELKDRMERAEKKAEEVDKLVGLPSASLKAEIIALQRQNAQLQTRSHRPSASVSVSGNPELPPSALLAQLESKSTTIEAMELEISNLRARLNSQLSQSSAYQVQISALEDKLHRSQTALEKAQRELADTKHSLTRASERAVKEGVDKTSTETLVKTLERQVQEMEYGKAEAAKKIETLEKKLQALGNLHRESENRNQTRLREKEKFEKEAVLLKRKLVTIENENLRLKEERERAKKRDAGAAGHDDDLDELEDEERVRLERRVRELEGEVFDLRRGIWKERRRELTDNAGQTHDPDDPLSSTGLEGAGANSFDDVDLVGGLPSGHEHSRRRSIGSKQQQHSSFTTVLSSGLAAFTGSSSRPLDHRYRPASSQGRAVSPSLNRSSVEFLTEMREENGEEDFDDDISFDEEAFAAAQAEEESRKRAEWVREVKRKLKDWKGWRLDLVDCRYGAQGAGVGMGEIFDV